MMLRKGELDPVFMENSDQAKNLKPIDEILSPAIPDL